MKLLNKLFSHELISGSFFIFLGSMLANFLAFVLNLFLARSLTYADYAIFASFLSVITLVSIPAGSMSTIIMKFATGFYAKKENDNLKHLYTISFKFVIGLSISIILLSFIFSGFIKQFLQVDDIWYVIISGFTIAAFYLNALNVAFLQSILKFGFISFQNTFGGIVKLIFGVILVILGFKAFGGLGSIFFMTLFMFLIAYIPLANILKIKSSSKKISINKKEIFNYAIPTFIAVLFLTSFTSMDVILVKHFFNPHLAGFYAGLSLIGKVIFYFTFPIPMVMFPLLVKRQASGKSFVNLFYLSLFLVILPSFAITAFYFIRPDFVINIFLGGREYLFISKYLGIFGIFLTVFSLVNVFVNFFLSQNKTKIFIPVVIAAILQIILIYLNHNDFYNIIYSSLTSLTGLLIILTFIFIKDYSSFLKIKKSSVILNAPAI